jgi:sugar phosphate isomerase/epimerase
MIPRTNTKDFNPWEGDGMGQTRREMLAGSAALAAGLAFGTSLRRATAETPKPGLRIGMCDWSMGCRAELTAFERAAQIGLDGVQVSMGDRDGKDNCKLRKPELQKEYLAASAKYKIPICSVGVGSLNQVPLKSEPHTAIWVLDTIETTKNLGADNILLAFFGRGELHADDPVEMRRVTRVLKELAPRAEKAGVILGLENTISAEDNLKVIEEVGSRFVQVYYDPYNLKKLGKDPAKEIRTLGKKNICQVHFKEGYNYLGKTGEIDWPSIVAALRDIGYDGWITLETANPSKDVVADTKKNIAYVRELFGVG